MILWIVRTFLFMLLCLVKKIRQILLNNTKEDVAPKAPLTRSSSPVHVDMNSNTRTKFSPGATSIY
jgi:hypothetical protein